MFVERSDFVARIVCKALLSLFATLACSFISFIVAADLSAPNRALLFDEWMRVVNNWRQCERYLLTFKLDSRTFPL